MATVAFDTLKAGRDLQAAGITQAPARVIVGSMAEAFSDTVAAKTDDVGLKAEMANLKAEMFRALWIQGGGLAVVQLAVAGLLYTLRTSSSP